MTSTRITFSNDAAYVYVAVTHDAGTTYTAQRAAALAALAASSFADYRIFEHKQDSATECRFLAGPGDSAHVEYRTHAAAEKAGNTYTARAWCRCGYKGKWTGTGRAQDLATAHHCDR